MSFQFFGWLRPLPSLVYNSAIKYQTCSNWLRQSHVMCSVLGKLMCLMKWSVWLTAETLTLTNETLASGFVTLQGKTNGSPSFMYTTSGISDCTFTNGRWLSETPKLRSGTNRHCIQTVDADNNLESATNTQRMLACYQTLSLSVVSSVALSPQLQYSCGNERLWVLLAPLFEALVLLKEREKISEHFNKSTPRTAGCFLVVLWFNIKDEGWG